MSEPRSPGIPAPNPPAPPADDRPEGTPRRTFEPSFPERHEPDRSPSPASPEPR